MLYFLIMLLKSWEVCDYEDGDDDDDDDGDGDGDGVFG